MWVGCSPDFILIVLLHNTGCLTAHAVYDSVEGFVGISTHLFSSLRKY